jgi:type 1 glutamine amidotransferase
MRSTVESVTPNWRLVRILAFLLLAAGALGAQPRQILYVTHSAGFRHDSLETSAQVLQDLTRTDGRVAVTWTEDVSQLNAASLALYDAVFFFTSGELPITAEQKAALLDFVRGGKGFGGAHSATDTFYMWPEYLDLIGARFNGHPWVHEVNVQVEDPAHSAIAHLTPEFRISAETYQFRDFSRQRSRVLLMLDTESVDLGHPQANPGTLDFPLAWCHPFGDGRVFYAALGHFRATWRDERFQQMMLQALLWLTGLAEGDANPRPLTSPQSSAVGVANAASLTPAGVVSPGQINAYVRPDIPLAAKSTTLEVQVADEAVMFDVNVAARTPGIFVVTVHDGYLTAWATGLGSVERRGGLDWTTVQPTALVNESEATVLYSGLAPGWPGLYQVNVEQPLEFSLPARLVLDFGDAQAAGEVARR